MPVRLDPRLSAVCDMVQNSGTVADIGCDHSRLSVAVLQRGAANRVIASDISAHSVKKAEVLREKTGLSEAALKIEQSDGLGHLLPGEADTIVFAGIGGTLAVRLIERHRGVAEAAKRLVFQPMRGIEDLRRYLFECGFLITAERLIEDGRRTYQVICAQPGVKQTFPKGWPDGMFLYGALMIKNRDPLIKPLLLRHKKELERTMHTAALRGAAPQAVAAQLEGINGLLRLYEEEEK